MQKFKHKYMVYFPNSSIFRDGKYIHFKEDIQIFGRVKDAKETAKRRGCYSCFIKKVY